MRLASGEDLHHIPHGTLLGEPGMSRQRDHTPPTWACQMTTTIAATEWRPSATAFFEAHVLVRRNSHPLNRRTAHRVVSSALVAGARERHPILRGGAGPPQA